MLIQDETPSSRAPFFKKGFPLIVLILSGIIIGVSLINFNASEALDDWMLRTFAVISGPGFVGLERPYGPFVPLIGHTLLHGNLFHLVMNMTAMLSFGPIVALGVGKSGRSIGLFVLFFAVCAIGGALAEILLADFQGNDQIAIGASSALSGFLPAVGYLRGGPKGAWSTSVPWIIINILLAISGGISAFPIAWAAHLGGLAAGFSFPLFLSLVRR